MDCTVTPGGLMHAQVHASSALTAQESGHGCFPAGFTCTVSHGHQRAPSAFKQVLAHGGWVGGWGLGTWVGPPRPQTVTAWIKSLSCNISVTNKISLWLLNFGPDTDLNTRSDVPAFISANTGVTCKESPEPDRGEVVHLCWVVCRTLWWIVGNAA